jgi:hypothetical protein
MAEQVFVARLIEGGQVRQAIEFEAPDPTTAWIEGNDGESTPCPVIGSRCSRNPSRRGNYSSLETTSVLPRRCAGGTSHRLLWTREGFVRVWDTCVIVEKPSPEFQSGRGTLRVAPDGS